MTVEPPAPEVSVIIAAWNAAPTVGRAVRSALEQTGVTVEVLLVDDASEDDTVAEARAAGRGNPHLHILRQTENVGPAVARNRAIKLATAPWVTALDSDDFMLPERLGTLLRIAHEESADFVADDLLRQAESDVSGQSRWRLWSQETIGRQRLSAADFIRGNLPDQDRQRRELGFIKPLMSRDFLKRHDLTYPDLRLGEDYALYTAALIKGARFVLTDPAGYVGVVREGSLSGEHPTAVHGALVALDTELLGQTRDPDTRRMLRAHRSAARTEWAWRKLIDAKRTGDLTAAARCFWAPPAVVSGLSQRLLSEAFSRTQHRLRPTERKNTAS